MSAVFSCDLSGIRWDMEQITLRIPENTLTAVEREADEHGTSRSEHIRDVLESRNDPTANTENTRVFR